MPCWARQNMTRTRPPLDSLFTFHSHTGCFFFNAVYVERRKAKIYCIFHKNICNRSSDKIKNVRLQGIVPQHFPHVDKCFSVVLERTTISSLCACCTTLKKVIIFNSEQQKLPLCHTLQHMEACLTCETSSIIRSCHVFMTKACFVRRPHKGVRRDHQMVWRFWRL